MTSSSSCANRSVNSQNFAAGKKFFSKKAFFSSLFLFFLLVRSSFLLAQSSAPMILEFDTNKGVAGRTISLPLGYARVGNFIQPSSPVNVSVDWGDGSTPEVILFGKTQAHTFTNDGIYTVTITGLAPSGPSLIGFGRPGITNPKLTKVISFGDLGLQSLAYAFDQATNLTEVPSSLPATVTSLEGTFSDASAFNHPIGSWDVSAVTNMFALFKGTPFNQDISSWKVGNVTTMANMFEANRSFNQNIGSWNVAKITDMGAMFFNASAFNQNIGSWDVSKVTVMASMFRGASSFNQDISLWNVSQVNLMNFMFADANGFNQDISKWNVSNVSTMSNMFFNARVFNQNIGGWNVSNVTDMGSMFRAATNFEQNIGGWNVSNVTTMSLMFGNVELTVANYDALLLGWSKQTLKPNVSFSGGWSFYSCVGEAARAILTSAPNSWTVSDFGKSSTTFTNTTTVSVCDSYKWELNGETYTASGTYSIPGSCVTEILALTITPSTTQTTTISACESYTWSVTGETYTQSGVYSKTTGCEKTILDLTITAPLTWYKDADNDGYYIGTPTISCTSPEEGVYTTTIIAAGDCDDSNAAINPGATEVCNGIDDDCDGQADQGFTDTDGDGKKDCVDTDDDNDGILDVNDCAQLDATKWIEGSFYADNDGDGYGSGTSQTLCYGTSTPTGFATVAGDCNDNNAAIRPGATEVCGDGIDNNCNGQTDEGCVASCVFTTFSQGGWATKNNPLTTSSFRSKFPTGFSIGVSGRSITLTTSAAVKSFLPNSGTPARLSCNVTNPTNKSLKNTFAGQLVAMRLNMAYNQGFAEATIFSTDAYKGWTVQRLFDEAVRKISSSSAVSSSILSSLSVACEKVNLSYHQGAVSGYVKCGENPTLKNNIEMFDMMSSSAKMQSNAKDINGLSMEVFGNPTANVFTVKVNSNKVQDISMRVTDINGRVREARAGLKNGQIVQFGSAYESGIFIVELLQENKRVIQKLVKLK